MLDPPAAATACRGDISASVATVTPSQYGTSKAAVSGVPGCAPISTLNTPLDTATVCVSLCSATPLAATP